MILLINPPVVKPSEPPAGVSRILGALHAHGLECAAWDANLECLLGLFCGEIPLRDRWTTRAVRNLDRNLQYIRARKGPLNFDRYKRCVSDLNRLLAGPWSNGAIQVSLTDYQDVILSPLKSTDLLAAAERPERNLFFPQFSAFLVELVRRYRPSLVGFSLNFLSQALTTFAMMGFLRRVEPSLKLVLGGGLVTSWMRGPHWREPFAGLVDFTVAGPGEDPLLSIATGKEVDMLHFTHDYDAFPMSGYLSPGAVVPYSGSSGCYWNKCGFCPERAEGNPYVPLPPHRVREDLGVLVETHSPTLIHLLDNAISPALLNNLVTHPPGVPWYGFARFTEHLADEAFAVELGRSGCAMLQLGLESGDQRVLDEEEKGMSLQTASKALSALKKAGISTYVYLLFGTPSETLEAARRTLDYVVAHAELIDFLNLAVFNLPIHSPKTARLRKEAFSDGDLSLYSGFAHPRGWNRTLVRRFLDREFKRHPAVATILRNDPPLFTSNHAPFFCQKMNGRSAV